MVLITFFLLTGPGILMWRLGGDGDLSSTEKIVKMLLQVIFDNLIIILLSYLTLNMMYGDIMFNLSAVYVDGLWNGIFRVDLVWKYGLLSCVTAVFLGLAKRVFSGLWTKRKRK